MYKFRQAPGGGLKQSYIKLKRSYICPNAEKSLPLPKTNPMKRIGILSDTHGTFDESLMNFILDGD